MNLSAKCNCCVCEPVCKYKEVYQNGIEAILNATISNKREDGEVGFWKVRECPHIEVSIKCPHMITNSGTISSGGISEMKNDYPELPVCPFCGSKPVTYDFYMRGHKIACQNPQCPIQPETIFYGYFDLAEKAWNTRSEMPEKPQNKNTY